MGIPKPHQTPSIDLSGHGKSWQKLTSEQLQVGDLIKGQGAIEAISPVHDEPLDYFTLTMKSGTKVYALTDSVHEVFGPTR